MKNTFYLLSISLLLSLSSCVSKKKLTEAEDKLMETESKLSKAENDISECENKNQELSSSIQSFSKKINTLQQDNKEKISIGEDGTLVSEKSKEKMRKVLQRVNPEKLANAKTLKDSINLAIAYNMEQKMKSTFGGNPKVESIKGDTNNSTMDGLSVSVNHPVVKITINNSVLFKSGSFWVNSSAHPLIGQLAELIKSEPNMEVLVEGHADAQKIVADSYLEDNWVLASKRSIAVVRLMESKFEVDGGQLIASSRSYYDPIADNDSAEGRAKNRRTTITLMPNVEKFMALIED